MGEWSKKVGEVGEEIAADFLNTIGWGAIQHGVPLPCVRPESHANAGHNRATHGIDYLFGYRSPLTDGVAHHLVVSVKFSAEPYPRNPVPRFKQHFTDLAHTLECFNNSTAKQEIAQGVRG